MRQRPVLYPYVRRSITAELLGALNGIVYQPSGWILSGRASND
jgi:hypothetical protein